LNIEKSKEKALQRYFLLYFTTRMVKQQKDSQETFVALNIRLPRRLADRLEAERKLHGVSKTANVIIALETLFGLRPFGKQK